jgi:hypothetical protein
MATLREIRKPKETAMNAKRESARRGKALWRRAAVVALVGVALVAGASIARAATTNYWGYGNLSASNPAAGTCPGSPAGVACSGWAYWDYSQIGWNSGRSAFAYGFICQSDGVFWGPAFGGSESFGTYSALWSNWCPSHYNKVAVVHLSGGGGTYNYVQGRGLIY